MVERVLIRRQKTLLGGTYLALRGLPGSFYPVATLDDIGLQANRSRATMEFQKEATGIAEDGAQLVSAP